MCITFTSMRVSVRAFMTIIFLQCNGQNIDWQLLTKLYEANAGRITETPGVSIVHKLKYEHLHLTNFSKMRVDLAVQVNVTSTSIYVYF